MVGRLRLAGGRHAARLSHDSDGPAWGAKEMRLVLLAGGVDAEQVTDKEELRARVRARMRTCLSCYREMSDTRSGAGICSDLTTGGRTS